MRYALTVLALAALAVLLRILLVNDSADPSRDVSSQLVEDRVPLLSAEQRARVAEYHAAMREEHDIDYRVLTTDARDDIDPLAYVHFSDARVGRLSRSGRGLLLVIDTALERVRLEVSTSLEAVYTDAFVAYVQNRQMAPFFQAGRVADGIVATTELIVARAQEAAAGSEFSPAMPAKSMGGGATAATAIGRGADLVRSHARQFPTSGAAGLDPRQVVELYLRAMADRDARTDLPFYSADTVRMLRDWVLTPAQMDNLAKTYRTCAVDAVPMQGELAVVRYRAEQRQCAPYFLRREDGDWKLDFAAASTSIRFNHQNAWRLAAEQGAGDYGFAFEDWQFDRHGFPVASGADR